jgi:hypothetical protein
MGFEPEFLRHFEDSRDYTPLASAGKCRTFSTIEWNRLHNDEWLKAPYKSILGVVPESDAGEACWIGTSGTWAGQ